MSGGDSTTSTELATRTKTNERYTREGLEQQAVAGFLHVDDEHADDRDRRYMLPEPYQKILVDPLSYFPQLKRHGIRYFLQRFGYLGCR